MLQFRAQEGFTGFPLKPAEVRVHKEVNPQNVKASVGWEVGGAGPQSSAFSPASGTRAGGGKGDALLSFVPST